MAGACLDIEDDVGMRLRDGEKSCVPVCGIRLLTFFGSCFSMVRLAKGALVTMGGMEEKVPMECSSMALEL